MLRQWREDFARTMREQGIAANATPRAARGISRSKKRDVRYRVRRHGASTALRADVTAIAKQLSETGAFRDPARARLIETRKAVVEHWMQIADTLDAQGEIPLAGDVRHFVQRLPRTLTEKELLAQRFIEDLRAKRAQAALPIDYSRDRTR